MKLNKLSVMTATALAGTFALGNTFAALGEDSAAMMSNNPSADNSSFYIAHNFDQVATLPSFTFSAPSGMVPSYGVVFGGVGGVTNVRGSSRTDGAASVGFGYGDAQESLGGAVTVGLGSINPSDGGALNRGYLGLSMGHFFTKTLTGVSAGINNIGGWHAGEGIPTQSYYLAATQLLSNNFMPVVVSAGVGNNLYTFQRSTKDRNTHVGVFGSVAVYVLPQVSLIADYTSGITTLGASLVPIAKLPIVVNLGARDVFEYGTNQHRVSFVGSISYAYSF